jgi:hypothetical protein
MLYWLFALWVFALVGSLNVPKYFLKMHDLNWMNADWS